MPSILYQNIGSACTNLGMAGMEFCVPAVVNCNATCTDFIITDLDGLWNCNFCQNESVYVHKYSPGAKIMVQTLFHDYYNPQPYTLNGGWGEFVKATLCDANGAPISTNHAAFASRWMVAWNTSGMGQSFQILELDTALIDALVTDGCWNLLIESFDSGGMQKDMYYTQHFKKNWTCDDLVTMKGDWGNTDCCGNFYDTGASGTNIIDKTDEGHIRFAYSNQLEFDAVFFDTGGGFSKTVFSSKKRTSVEITRNYIFRVRDFVPPWVKNVIVEQMLAARVVTIDGVEYTIDEFAVQAESKKGRMFAFSAVLSGVCNIPYEC